jgi:tetratricopeptide (TPR) repeat protein
VIKNNNVSIAEAHFNKACYLHNRGNIMKAIENFKISIRYNSTSKAYYWLAGAYGLQGRFEAAIDQAFILLPCSS